MLQTIREHTQGWIAGTIITIIILTFALWGVHSYFVGGTPNTTLAEVNGVEISKEQVAMTYERMRRQIQATTKKSVTSQEETALKERALKSLIEVEALKQAAQKQGFQVSDAEIDSYLQTVPEFQVDGQFSVERFQEILSAIMMSTSEFLELVRTSLLIDQPKFGIVLSSFALPDETQESIAIVNQERDIDYIQIPQQSFLTKPIPISADKIKAYYAEHQSAFMTPEQVSVDYIELTIPHIAATLTPTDAQLKTTYEENVNAYTEPMQWKLADIEIPVTPQATAKDQAAAEKKVEAVLTTLKSGEDFMTVAKNYSSTLNGSTWMGVNQLPEELQKPVLDMQTPGQISEQAIKTSKGYVILRVVDIKQPTIQPFENVKNKVKEAYVRQHAEEKFAELREQLANLTYEHPDSLEVAAKNLNLPIKTSEPFTQEKGGKDISQSQAVRKIAFSNDVLNSQNNSDVIQINAETAIVLRNKSHVKAALLPLAAVSKQIEDQLKTQVADEQSEKLANELLAKLKAGANLQQLAENYKFTLHHSGYLGRYSNKVDTAVLDMAFRMSNSTSANQPTYSIARIPNGYAIVALKGVREGALDKKEYPVFAEQVQTSEGLLEYELYKLSQINNAKIEMN